MPIQNILPGLNVILSLVMGGGTIYFITTNLLFLASICFLTLTVSQLFSVPEEEYPVSKE